jgi:hypothetical protein
VKTALTTTITPGHRKRAYQDRLTMSQFRSDGSPLEHDHQQTLLRTGDRKEGISQPFVELPVDLADLAVS